MGAQTACLGEAGPKVGVLGARVWLRREASQEEEIKKHESRFRLR